MARFEKGGAVRDLGRLFGARASVGASDARLLERFLDRDDRDGAEAAFAALVERHGGMVRRVCARVLADPADLPDAVQATFFVLALKARTLRRRDGLAGWLHGVAVRVARSANAAAAARRRRERARSVPASATYEPEPPEAREERDALHRAIERLPERFRTAVILCDLEGLTDAQAAERLGCPVGTVKSRLSTARRRLRARLGAGAALGPAAPSIPLPASLPDGLAERTARAAVAWAHGGAATAAALGRAWTLSNGVSHAMSRISIIWAFLGGLAATGLVGTAAAWSSRVGDDPPAPAAKPPAAVSEKKPRAAVVIRDADRRDRLELALKKAREAAEAAPAFGRLVALMSVDMTEVKLGRRDRKATLARWRTLDERDDLSNSATVDEARIKVAGSEVSDQAAEGDAAATREAVERLLRLYRELKAAEVRIAEDELSAYSRLDQAMDWIPSSLMSAGYADLAIRVANAVEDPAWRAQILARAGTPGAKEGALRDVARVLDLAEAAADEAAKPRPSDDDLLPKSAAQSRSMHLESQRAFTARLMTDGLCDLIRRFVAAGDREAARDRLERLRTWADRDTPWNRPWALAQVAMARRLLGDEEAARAGFAEAIALAERSAVPRDRDIGALRNTLPRTFVDPVEQLWGIARCQYQSGDKAGARITLQKAEAISESNPNLGEQAARYVASGWIEVEDWAAATRMLDVVSRRVRERAKGLGLGDDAPDTNEMGLNESLAQRWAAAGGDREALDWAMKRPDPVIRTQALVGVVKGILDREANP